MGCGYPHPFLKTTTKKGQVPYLPRLLTIFYAQCDLTIRISVSESLMMSSPIRLHLFLVTEIMLDGANLLIQSLEVKQQKVRRIDFILVILHFIGVP